MRTLLIAAGVLFLVAPAFADDVTQPLAITPKEAAEGWLLLFDGSTTFGWAIDGAAEVKDGVLILGKGGKKTTASTTVNFGQTSSYSLEMLGQARVHTPHWTFNTPAKADKWKFFKVTYDEKEVTTQASPGIDFGGNRPKVAETAQLTIETNGEKEVMVRSVKLKPFIPKPLFDGKDLSGWKVNAADPKRTASKFTVTESGELAVKNGPGDLVTEKEFDNFVLQFECKTNGDGLNSGIFFRCIPGQYQNGYEAQIQNAFLNNDRTKPKDFGTGAIYRRVPARKVVSDDKEWFTMTVVADGKHIATWVNGYQTVDWTDDRKESENPRQGYRAAKGPLSIQGHDPTTDLLFRNIRIAELGGKK
jgi:hypothetical protein